MTAALTLSLAVFCASPQAPVDAAPRTDAARADTVAVRLFDEGMTFDSFLEATERRRDTWHGNYERAPMPADLAERALCELCPEQFLQFHDQFARQMRRECRANQRARLLGFRRE